MNKVNISISKMLNLKEDQRSPSTTLEDILRKIFPMILPRLEKLKEVMKSFLSRSNRGIFPTC